MEMRRDSGRLVWGVGLLALGLLLLLTAPRQPRIRRNQLGCDLAALAGNLYLCRAGKDSRVSECVGDEGGA